MYNRPEEELALRICIKRRRNGSRKYKMKNDKVNKMEVAEKEAKSIRKIMKAGRRIAPNSGDKTSTKKMETEVVEEKFSNDEENVNKRPCQKRRWDDWWKGVTEPKKTPAHPQPLKPNRKKKEETLTRRLAV